MKKIKYRNEVKHYINIIDYYSIKNRIKHVSSTDKYSNSDGKYKIRSLYFDNFENKALMEKLNGISKREKFRIRFYNNNINFIRLEKKSKNNKFCNKESARISALQCEKIINKDIDWMIHSNNSLIKELYIKMKNQFMRPKTIVEYTREAYVYPAGNVRITIDSELKTAFMLKDFLNPKIPTLSVDSNSKIILEVKFDDFLPDIIRDFIQTNERNNSAISKYAACRIYG